MLTKVVFTLGIPPTWRSVVIMTSMTTLHLVYNKIQIYDKFARTRQAAETDCEIGDFKNFYTRL